MADQAGVDETDGASCAGISRRRFLRAGGLCAGGLWATGVLSGCQSLEAVGLPDQPGLPGEDFDYASAYV